MDWIVGVNSQIYFATLDLVWQNTLNNCFRQSLSTSSQSCHIDFFFSVPLLVFWPSLIFPCVLPLVIIFTLTHSQLYSTAQKLHHQTTPVLEWPHWILMLYGGWRARVYGERFVLRTVCCLKVKWWWRWWGGGKTSHSSSTLPPLGFP